MSPFGVRWEGEGVSFSRSTLFDRLNCFESHLKLGLKFCEVVPGKIKIHVEVCISLIILFRLCKFEMIQNIVRGQCEV